MSPMIPRRMIPRRPAAASPGLRRLRSAFRRSVAAAVLLAAMPPVPAQAGATLRASALVSGAIVTAGDLIDGAGDKASVALFRAPDPGQTGMVPAASVIEAARRAGVGDVVSSVSEIAVTRAGREITSATIEGLITTRAATEYGVDVDAVEVALDDAGPVRLDAAAKGAVSLGGFALDPKTGRFDATLEVAGWAAGAPVRVTGQAVETIETAVLTRSFDRGAVIAAADVRTERRPKAQNADSAAPEDVVGMALRRPVREGQALRSADLTRPQHVERGGFVTLIYVSEGVSLSLRAKALAAGSAGDIIPVQNIQSKRVVNGVVTGPSEVTVSAPVAAVARR